MDFKKNHLQTIILLLVITWIGLNHTLLCGKDQHMLWMPVCLTSKSPSSN